MSKGQAGADPMSPSGYFVSHDAIKQFRNLGYVRLDGLLNPYETQIPAAFEDLFTASTPRRGQRGRLGVPRAGTRHPLLRSLLTSLIEPAAEQITGNRVTYLGGDAVVYEGDSYWHRDGNHSAAVIIKVVTCLDPLDGASGALRVLPATHGKDTDWAQHLQWLREPEEHLGVTGDRLPSVVIPTHPGDAIVFDTHILHSAFRGGGSRRQITWTFANSLDDPAAAQEITRYILADHGVV
ncbi:phytanoyl-CoA dioxygenase family protein [Streptomyces spectabilis]|uniref:phytanoyl-CoA dioxygenase family protein n=1 Tax=Streptomyces spectabilis TaxID=68270 RepID=UPI0033F0B6D1